MTNCRDTLTRGPLLKVGRAKEHINDLNRAIDSYLGERPLRLFRGQYPKLAQSMVFVKTKKPVPDELSLILGDAIHNLRTALDLIAFGIAGDKAPRPDRLQFPFGKSAETYGSTIATRQMHVASKEVIDALHSFKPYPGGNELLHGLHELDVRDKHHLILTVGGVPTLSAFQFGLLTGLNATGEGTVTFSNPTGILMTWDMTPEIRRRLTTVEQEAEFQPTFTICFGQTEPFAGQVVTPKLGLLASEVVGVITKLADAHCGT